MAGISAAGVGSNLDVAGLVDRLMAVEQKPLTELDKKQAAVTVKLSAFGTFKGAVSSFQSSLLALEQSSAYTANNVKMADSSIATASAAAGADLGSHTLEVTNLAAAQRLKSDPFTSLTDTVGTGTLTIQFGSYESTGNTFTANANRGVQSISIDSAHNTLSGVRDAINSAKAGVTASIVNDGSGNRLVLASNSTGTENSLKISVADDDGTAADASGLSKLAYDPTSTPGAGKNMSQVVGAENAKFKLDGLEITKSSNTVTDAIAGTTLNLLKTNTGAPTSMTVSRDTSGVKTAVDAFVKAYNELDTTVDKLTGYDAATQTAGTLLGDPTVRSLASQIRDGLSAVVSNTSGGSSYNALAQVGISLDRTGQLKVDGTKLQKALDTDPVAVQGLFATSGYSKDSLVSYVKSETGTTSGKYALNLAQIATQGSATGSSAAGLTFDSNNDQFSVTVNGKLSTIALNQSTYTTTAALAADIQSKLNGSTAFSEAGISVSVTETNGILSLKSNAYGSASKIEFGSGSAQSSLFGATPNVVDGVDVAGSLGTGIATGNGQTLTASNGLAVSILGGATGERGTVSFTRGIAVQLDNLLAKATNSKGIIAARSETLNKTSKDMDAQRVRIQAQLELKKTRYTAQFSTLDGLLTKQQQTMSYLSQQLSALNNLG
ncbi:MAG: hypothetical protein RL701_6895 [Pseudomonadota bacterium]